MSGPKGFTSVYADVYTTKLINDIFHLKSKLFRETSILYLYRFSVKFRRFSYIISLHSTTFFIALVINKFGKIYLDLSLLSLWENRWNFIKIQRNLEGKPDSSNSWTTIAIKFPWFYCEFSCIPGQYFFRRRLGYHQYTVKFHCTKCVETCIQRSGKHLRLLFPENAQFRRMFFYYLISPSPAFPHIFFSVKWLGGQRTTGVYDRASPMLGGIWSGREGGRETGGGEVSSEQTRVDSVERVFF